MSEATNWNKLNEMAANREKFQLIFFGLKEGHVLRIDINANVNVMQCLS